MLEKSKLETIYSCIGSKLLTVCCLNLYIQFTLRLFVLGNFLFIFLRFYISSIKQQKPFQQKYLMLLLIIEETSYLWSVDSIQNQRN